MTSKTVREAARAHKSRLKRHRAEQRKHRAKNKAERRPDRDDVAGAALRLVLNSIVLHPERELAYIAGLASNLAELKKPFDPAKTTAVVKAMVERYREEMDRVAREPTEDLERGT